MLWPLYRFQSKADWAKPPGATAIALVAAAACNTVRRWSFVFMGLSPMGV
jgi:hypothetical protein